MRTLIKVQIPAAAGNRALKEGTLGQIMGQALEALKPEAAYFTVDGGQRTAFLVVDLKDSSDMPFVAERFFLGLEATVDITPAMTAEELKTGLSRIA